MKNSLLVNDRIYLRPVEPEDLDIMYVMENDPAFWEISCLTVPYSRYILKEYIENSQSDMYADKQIRLMIIRRDDEVTLGTIDITDYAPLHGRGAVGIGLLEPYRGLGYAADALALLCEYAFEFLRFKQLYAHIPADNEASLKLFAGNGFEQSGLLKSWLVSGQSYKDVVIMQRIV